MGERKRLVYWSGGVMAASCVLFSVTSSFGICLFLGLLFGVGYGAFSVLDWAMATDILPSEAEFAKDMGIWSLAMVLPQVIAAPMAGYVLDFGEKMGNGKNGGYHLGYGMVFMLSCAFYSLGTYYVKKIESIN